MWKWTSLVWLYCGLDRDNGHFLYHNQPWVGIGLIECNPWWIYVPSCNLVSSAYNIWQHIIRLIIRQINLFAFLYYRKLFILKTLTSFISAPFIILMFNCSWWLWSNEGKFAKNKKKWEDINIAFIWYNCSKIMLSVIVDGL